MRSLDDAAGRTVDWHATRPNAQEKMRYGDRYSSGSTDDVTVFKPTAERRLGAAPVWSKTVRLLPYRSTSQHSRTPYSRYQSSFAPLSNFRVESESTSTTRSGGPHT